MSRGVTERRLSDPEPPVKFPRTPSSHGSTLWAADLAQFETFSQLLVSNTVPPGSYSLRLRGKNARGVRSYSEMTSISA